ncbi:Protein DMP - like 6 [Theobroma cacao]|nr:Protein DMP - like 6 [Theobroma cacao]
MVLPKVNLAQSAHKALPGSANLANLLPTGTVFAFQAIVPSFSNNGRCEAAHKYMTLGVIILCSLACFLSSFTDSFVGEDGKLYYGIATCNGLYVFNDDNDDALDLEKDSVNKMLKKYRLTAKDFVHACCSLTLFLVIACSSFDVQRCYFPNPGPNGDALMANLPLAAGILASGLFMLFPTKRRGIGYADRLESDHGDKKEEKESLKKGDKELLPRSKTTPN